MKSRVVALSAISAAFIALFLTLGAYIELIDIIAVIAASVFATLPLYYGSKTGCVLAYLAGGVLAFIISGANIYSLVFPAYFAYFGIIPILNEVVKNSKLNNKLWFLIKFIWFMVLVYALLWYYTAVMGMPIEYSFDIFGKAFDFTDVNNIYYIFLAALGLAGILIFLLYERFTVLSRRATDKLLARIIKK